MIAPSKGIKTAKELAEKAKAGEMTYASAGVGSATHWGAERFRLSAGFKATHVPFRGGPAALTEVATGRVDLDDDRHRLRPAVHPGRHASFHSR